MSCRALILRSLAATCCLAFSTVRGAPAGFGCEEDFSDLQGLARQGWDIHDNSAPAAGWTWSQGDASTFPASSGVADSYAMADMRTEASGVEHVSLWLVSPEFDLDPTINARQLSFQLRTLSGTSGHLLIRLCETGFNHACTAPGPDPYDIGGFDQVLLDVDAAASLQAFPNQWTETFADGLPIVGRVRVAFQYAATVSQGSSGGLVGLDGMALAGVSICPFSDVVFADRFEH